MRKVLVVLFCLIFVNLFGQEQFNSQFQINKIESNPANGDSYGDKKLSFGGVFKSSFYPIRGPYNLSNVFLNYSFPSINNFKSNLGFLFNNETQGDGYLSLSKYSFNWGCSIKVKKKGWFNIGLRPGLYNQSINWNELTFSDQLNPIYGITNNSNNQYASINNSTSFNLDLGLKFNFVFDKSNDLNLGIGFFNVLEPKIGVLNTYTLPRRFSFQINYIGKSEEFKFLPIFNHHFRCERQSNFKQLAYNMELIFKQGYSFGAGLKYSSFSNISNNLSLPIMISYIYDDKIKCYTSWEPNIVGYSSNTFEFGIIFISSNEIEGFKDVKDFFGKSNCGNRF